VNFPAILCHYCRGRPRGNKGANHSGTLFSRRVFSNKCQGRRADTGSYRCRLGTAGIVHCLHKLRIDASCNPDMADNNANYCRSNGDADRWKYRSEP
jgi:hypothetical protein